MDAHTTASDMETDTPGDTGAADAALEDARAAMTASSAPQAPYGAPEGSVDWTGQRRFDGVCFDLVNPLDLRAAVHALVAAREDDELREGSAGTDIDREHPRRVQRIPTPPPRCLLSSLQLIATPLAA